MNAWLVYRCECEYSYLCDLLLTVVFICRTPQCGSSMDASMDAKYFGRYFDIHIFRSFYQSSVSRRIDQSRKLSRLYLMILVTSFNLFTTVYKYL